MPSVSSSSSSEEYDDVVTETEEVIIDEDDQTPTRGNRLCPQGHLISFRTLKEKKQGKRDISRRVIPFCIVCSQGRKSRNKQK
jgi:hypothetical protein